MSSKSSTVRIGLIVLSIIGLILAFISLDHVLSGSLGLQTEPSFCNISEAINCDAVNASGWSSFLGIPVAGFGVAFYFMLLSLGITSKKEWGFADETLSRLTFFSGMISSVISVFLFFVSKYIIGSLCLICIGMYAVNFGILLLGFYAISKGSLFGEFTGSVSEVFKFLSHAFFLSGAPGRPRILRQITVIVGLVMFFAFGIIPGRIIAEQKLKAELAESANLSGFEKWRRAPVQNAFGRESTSLLSSNFSKGSPSAPLKIVEFADVECPACRRLSRVIADLVKEYGDKVQLTFRNYPIDKACNPGVKVERHRFACLGANYARCAGEQGKFFEALEFLFAYPNFEEAHSVGLVANDLIVQAKALGLDGDAMKECLDSKRHISKIQEDIRDADALGLQSTPSLWINGRFVAPKSLEDLKKILDFEIAKK